MAKPSGRLNSRLDQRRVELERETVIDGVAGDQLCDGAVLVLAGRIRNFVSVHQHGSKVSELLRDCAVKSAPPWPRCTRLHPRHCFELWRVTPAKVTSATC